MTRVVACHQPNFIPWLGFFAKMARSDVFVLLDDVQFTQGPNRHNWTSRVRILASNGAHWLSIPVQRAGEGRQLIRDLHSTPGDVRWLSKMLRTIEESYRKSPHGASVLPPLLGDLALHDGSICDTNIRLIHRIASLLKIPGKRVLSSARLVEGTATARLVNLTLAEGGSTYLSGDGADDYQVEAAFRAAGVQVRKLGFRHPEYRQRADAPFVAGLSILDALCYAGVDATRAMLFDNASHV